MAKRRVPMARMGMLGVVVAVLPAEALAAGFKIIPDVPTLAVNTVVFLLLIYPVNKLLIAPLVQLLVDRERQSQGAETRTIELVEQTRELTVELDARLVAARSAAQARRAAILAEGQAEENRLLAQSRQQAAETVESMRTAVAREMVGARGALRAEAQVLAREAASRILGRSL